MDHASWKAFIKLSLVSIPVRGYSASVPARDTIHFHQLHDEDHNRIRYQKVCPAHGEVSNDEIVKGYEYAKDQYVIVDPEELERLQVGGERSINVSAFVHPEDIDPIYFSGKSYYLLPDGAAGTKPYALLQEAMARESRYAITQVVLSGREELMVLRTMEKVLVLDGLSYKSEVRDAAGFSRQLDEQDFSAKELQLTEALIEASTPGHFDLGQYHDVYAEKLKELIEAKAAGKELVAAPASEPTPVINLMDALRASLERAQKRPSASGNGTSPRRGKAGARPHRAVRGRRKTG
jgi:DNA end-binding protein Ku